MERAEIAPPPVHRALQIGTAGLTLAVSSAPVWAAIIAPRLWMVAFAVFSVYWLYCSLSIVLFAAIGYLRLRRWQRHDWMGALRSRRTSERWRHLVVYPICGEPLELLEESLAALAAQTFPTERVNVLLAFEARDEAAMEKAARLRARFVDRFGTIFATLHTVRSGAVKGKASNLAFAVPIAQHLLAEQGIEPEWVLVTVCDADSRLDPNYLAALTATYLSRPNGERSLYQPAMLFYANWQRLPVWAQVVDGLYSVIQVGRLVAGYKLIAQSTYSLRLSELRRIGYWDVDVVPEDSHTFFKLFFRFDGAVTPRPIYLPVWADACEGATWWGTAINHYRQARRWAWGVSDVPYIAWQALTGRRLSLGARVSRPFHYGIGHLFWPAHWFLLMGGLRLVQETYPRIALSPSGEALMDFSAVMLTLTTPAVLGVVALDLALRRLRDPSARLLGPLALALWLALPILGLLLSVLPALEAHLRLLLGRPLAYEVTQKQVAPAAQAPLPTGVLRDRSAA